jgi:3-dehydro-glucose-6-phosphate--glutamate transaminase
MKDVTSINQELASLFEAKEATIDLDQSKLRYSDLFEVIKLESEFIEIKHTSFLPLERLNSSRERSECLKAISTVITTGHFTSGVFIEQLEVALKDFYNAQACIATSSGTDALKIGLKAVGVEAGDEVILPVNSFAATENAIFSIGAVPRFANIDASYNILPGEIERIATHRTKAVMPVCLYGSMSNIKDVFHEARKHGLKVIVDAAQCFGIRELISYGDVMALSFNPFKNIGSYGKSGALLTTCELAARHARRYSYHGFEENKKNVKIQDWGFNSRMDNMQAAILLAKLRFFERNATKRSFLAMRYLKEMKELDNVQLDLPLERIENTWHLFPLLIKRDSRDALISFAKDRGVELDIYYPILSHRYASPYALNYSKKEQFETSERIHESTVHIPLHNHMSLEEQDRAMEVINAFFK